MQYQRKILSSLLIASGIISVPQVAVANDSSELEQLRALVQELDQKVKILARQGELKEEAEAAAKKEAPVVTASDKGFGIKSADGKFEYQLRGLVHADYRTWVDDDKKPNTEGFTLRRIRPTFQGTVFGKYDFRFTPEFGENKSAVVDAYLDARFQPWAKVRAGKFKPFVGLERLQSGGDIKFIERSYVSNNILPNRDQGVSLYGDLFNNKLSYAVGVFNGVNDGAENTTTQDTNKDKDYAARVFVTPFKDSDSVLSGLGFGIAATYANQRGSASSTGLSSYKTPGQAANFFSYLVGGTPTTANTTHADGSRIRWTPQGYYYNGPFGVIAEYARVSQDVRRGNSRDSLDNDAWQVAASWLLTGEDASFKGVKPKKAFATDGDGWGAFELVARYQELNVDDRAFEGSTTSTGLLAFADLTAAAKKAQTWGVGVNWYLNQDVKIVANYEHTTFDGGGGGTKNGSGVVTSALDREDEDILFTRLQYSF